MKHVTEAHTLSIRTDDVDCEWTWYTENISKVTLQRKRLFLLKIGSWHLGVCYSGTVYTIAKWTPPLCAAKGTLHDGINISVCENNS